MSGFFSSVPPARDWFYGVRTFGASMLALYIALLMEMPRPYWAMATVYIVSSPFVGPTSSKAHARAAGQPETHAAKGLRLARKHRRWSAT